MTHPPAFSQLYRHARREAAVVLAVTLLALLWTVGYCYLFGYRHGPESWVVQAGLAHEYDPAAFQHFGGVPDWVFLGILLPWLLCSAFTVGFCLGMKDDDLGADVEEGPGHGH